MDCLIKQCRLAIDASRTRYPGEINEELRLVLERKYRLAILDVDIVRPPGYEDASEAGIEIDWALRHFCTIYGMNKYIHRYYPDKPRVFYYWPEDWQNVAIAARVCDEMYEYELILHAILRGMTRAELDEIYVATDEEWRAANARYEHERKKLTRADKLRFAGPGALRFDAQRPRTSAQATRESIVRTEEIAERARREVEEAKGSSEIRKAHQH
jgi:hypothetical protein